MAIPCQCVHCGQRLQAKPKHAGQIVRCVACGEPTPVPESDPSLDETKTFIPSTGTDAESFPTFELKESPKPTQKQRPRRTRRQKQKRTLYFTLGSLGGLFAILVAVIAMSGGDSKPKDKPQTKGVAKTTPGESVAVVDGKTEVLAGPPITKTVPVFRKPPAQKSRDTEPSQPPVRTKIPTRPQNNSTFENGQRLSWIGGPTAPAGVVNSPNLTYTGKVVARNSVGLVPVITVNSEPFSILRFSPDDQQIVVQSNLKTLRLLRRADSTSDSSWDSVASLDHQDEVYDAVFSPDGELLVTGSGPPGTVPGTKPSPGQLKFWNAETGELLGRALEFRHRVRCVAFSADGKLLAVGASGFDPNASRKTLYGFAPADAVYLIDVKSRKQKFSPLKNVGEVHVLQFSPDGKRLVTAGLMDSSVRIWNVGNGKAVGKPIPHTAGISEVLFDRTGKKLITGCHDGKVYVRNAATGRVIVDCQDTIPEVAKTKTGHFRTLLAITPDGKRMASARFKGGKVRLWTVATGKPVGTPIEHAQTVSVIKIDPQGQLLLSGDYSGTAQFWSMATGKPIGPPMKHGGAVVAATFSHDGRLLLTASITGIRLWKVPRAL